MVGEAPENLFEWMVEKIVDPAVDAFTRATSQWFLPYVYFAVLSAFVILLVRRYDRGRTLRQNLAGLLLTKSNVLLLRRAT